MTSKTLDSDIRRGAERAVSTDVSVNSTPVSLVRSIYGSTFIWLGLP